MEQKRELTPLLQQISDNEISESYNGDEFQYSRPGTPPHPPYGEDVSVHNPVVSNEMRGTATVTNAANNGGSAAPSPAATPTKPSPMFSSKKMNAKLVAARLRHVLDDDKRARDRFRR